MGTSLEVGSTGSRAFSCHSLLFVHPSPLLVYFGVPFIIFLSTSGIFFCFHYLTSSRVIFVFCVVYSCLLDEQVEELFNVREEVGYFEQAVVLPTAITWLWCLRLIFVSFCFVFSKSVSAGSSELSTFRFVMVRLASRTPVVACEDDPSPTIGVVFT